MPLNYKLLNQVANLYGLDKKAYVPPPFDPSIEQQGVSPGAPPGAPPDAPPGAPGGVSEPVTNPEQLMQEVYQTILQAQQQGAPPEQVIPQVAQSLASRGVNPEMIDQIMQTVLAQIDNEQQQQQPQPQPPPEQPQPQPEPIDVKKTVNTYVKEEEEKLQQASTPPEQRLFTLERKVEAIMDLLQEVLGGIPKQANDMEYYQNVVDYMQNK